MSREVRDNPDRSRYEVFLDGRLAGSALYLLHDGRITVVHTEIDEAYEGSGLGGFLARGVLEDVKARGLTLEPLCPFLAGYIRRHRDEFLELVIPGMREQVVVGG
jgi:uncharacterized protein